MHSPTHLLFPHHQPLSPPTALSPPPPPSDFSVFSHSDILNDQAFISLYQASVLCNASIFDEGPIDPKMPGSPSNLSLPVLQRRCVQGNASVRQAFFVDPMADDSSRMLSRK